MKKIIVSLIFLSFQQILFSAHAHAPMEHNNQRTSQSGAATYQQYGQGRRTETWQNASNLSKAKAILSYAKHTAKNILSSPIVSTTAFIKYPKDVREYKQNYITGKLLQYQSKLKKD